jgi:hypothetical protein
MRSLFHTNRIMIALCANAALLLLILISVSTRQGRAQAGAIAVTTAESRPPTTAPSGGTLTVMPGQLSPNHWGCYVMDSQNQTLCVYQFDPSGTELRLAAARDIQYDRRLGYFNTTPSPTEIKAMVDRADLPVRAAPTTNRSPEQ